MNYPPWYPSADEPGLPHDPRGDKWQRHCPDVPERDVEADRAIRREIQQEQAGEYDADGNFRRSSWGSDISQSTNTWKTR